MFDNLRENFEIILIVVFILSSISYVTYKLTFFKNIKTDINANIDSLKSLPRKKRKNLKNNILSSHLNTFFRKIIYFFADLFWVLLFVVVIRSFIFEPFIIPSGSMKPGLQIGDIIIVNKFEKGLRLPINNKRITKGEPINRGDVLVFKYPGNPNISYIKRVIGIPGDKVYYDNRNMIINGKKIDLTQIRNINDNVDFTTANGTVKKKGSFTIYQENLLGLKHSIRYSNNFKTDFPAREWIIPKNKYLMMGDNRDNSADGRAFGFLDDKLIIGKAKRIILNFDCLKFKGKCDRFFKKIN